MKDFLQKYHKKEQKMMLFLVAGAFVLALGVNMFMFDGTNLGSQMKASLLESSSDQNKANLYTENNEGTITIKNGNVMKDSESISVSVGYNSEILEITNIRSSFGEVTILGEKSDGMLNLILSKNIDTIDVGTSIFEITTKKLVNESTQINIFNANFTDTKKQSYELTTSGITF